MFDDFAAYLVLNSKTIVSIILSILADNLVLTCWRDLAALQVADEPGFEMSLSLEKV